MFVLPLLLSIEDNSSFDWESLAIALTTIVMLAFIILFINYFYQLIVPDIKNRYKKYKLDKKPFPNYVLVQGLKLKIGDKILITPLRNYATPSYCSKDIIIGFDFDEEKNVILIHFKSDNKFWKYEFTYFTIKKLINNREIPWL